MLRHKESACSAGDLSSIPGLGPSPEGGHGNPFQYSCLENPHGQRSLAGYSPWDCKELDTTELLSTQHSLYTGKFLVHVLLKPGLENFEHYLACEMKATDCSLSIL